MDIFIKNPLEPSINAAKMVAKAVTSLSIYVNDQFLLWGSIKELKLTVVNYEPYFKTQTSIETINSKLSIMLPLMEAYANSVLDDGWRLPLSSNITRYIKRQKVQYRDGYILIDGDAEFKQQAFIRSQLRQVRQLQSIPEHRQKATKQNPNQYPSIMTEAHERFYNLVEKVYLLKLQNGELDQNTFGDVMSAVDEVMTPIKNEVNQEHVENIQKAWT